MSYDFDRIKSELSKTRAKMTEQADSFKDEALEKWSGLEDKWAEFELKFESSKKTAEKSKKNIFTALELMKGEIIKGYDEIKSTVKRKI